MTPQERDLLEGLFARIRTAPAGARDAEADAFISEQVRQNPQAAYLLSQTVIVQEEALKAAVAKIEELNTRVSQLEEAEREQSSSFLGGFGKSIFGGAEPAGTAGRGSVPSVAGWRSQDQQAGEPPRTGGIGMPNVAPAAGRWTQQGRPLAAAEQPQQGGGGSFLKGALGAAAGVAGGMLLANSLSGLFKESGNPLGIADGKAGAKGDGQNGAASQQTADSGQKADSGQPWGSNASEDTGSASDDGFDNDGWDAADSDDDGGWSDDA